jgi:hypothetical protein
MALKNMTHWLKYPIYFYVFKNFEIFLFFSLLQINIFFMFLDHFDALMLKLIFLKKYIILIHNHISKHVNISFDA